MSDSTSDDSADPSARAPTARPSNRLADEASAYLRQHMHNPVDWFAWGSDALDLARREDRPLLVSIGYSACHWCHVMERESFEDPETAQLMNRLFVCIKVDREERPDVDQIYMDTVTALTGQGGWPLTVFCQPDGKPFYGGTYFPPEPRQGTPSFREVLVAVERTYRERRGEVDDTSARILAALTTPTAGSANEAPGAATAAQAAMRLLQRADPEHGGFASAPKFPTPTSLDLLLAAIDALPARKGREALDHVILTCREMARGGVYDQLGGAFHRYSVDGHWGVPHFEKMLYDEGQLLRVYVEAWRRGGASDDNLLWPVRETVEYLRREMEAPDGGFYASQDADSEGEEGTFYVWTAQQIEAVLGAERSEKFCSAYGVTDHGNFEHGTTVLRDVAREDRDVLAAERALLFEARAGREAPATDTKRVASWNGYAISGLARAGSLLEDASMLATAAATADFVFEKMIDEQGRLLRVYNRGRASVAAFLDDHAALLEASLDLFRAGAGERFASCALRLADDIAGRFFDEEAGDLFFTAADAQALAMRPRSDHDGATPHSCGLAVLGLLRAGSLAGRADLDALARRVILTHAVSLERAPEAFPTLARAALLGARGPSSAVIVGNPEDDATRALATRARLLLGPEDAVLVAAPGAAPAEAVDASWFAGRMAVDGRPTAYVCRGTTCSAPVTSARELSPLDPDL